MLLLEKGVEPDTKDKYGRMPPPGAAMKRHEAMVKLLLEKGAEPDGDGRTPLWYAAAKRHEATVKPLLEKGTELEPKCSHG
jgi:ankyrin repeat protein